MAQFSLVTAPTSIDSNPHWKALSRSVTGTRHVRNHQPCQDWGNVRTMGGVLFGAVADGAGSACYADRGAQIAVATTLDFLQSTEEWLQQRRRSWRCWGAKTTPPPPHLVQKLFTKTLHQVLMAFSAQANGHGIEDFACTLIAFVATRDWLAAMQIGDGFLVVTTSGSGIGPSLSFRGDPQAYHLLFSPHKGEYANQTSFVTSADALTQLQTRIVERPRFICAATDGLESVAIRQRDRTCFAPFFHPLREYLQELAQPLPDVPAGNADQYLLDFLQSERLNQRTDDDKTLLLALNLDP
jgi:Protein phosphatase 2C